MKSTRIVQPRKPGPTPGKAPVSQADVNARLNIATYHRDHMRYYVMHQMELAADISREANKLKVFGDYWLRGGDDWRSSFDPSDPRYKAAGCGDLTPLTAIAGMGILFMEGEGEPDEIRLLKEKLGNLSHRFVSKGEWLADKMDAAWKRESVLLSPDSIVAASPRFQVIATDWQGSRETVLVGRLIGLALECLNKIEFTPAAVRKNRQPWGRSLLYAGWLLDMAARLLSKVAGDLSQADTQLTDYVATITAAGASGLGAPSAGQR